MKAQVLYDLRQLTGYCSGTDLHEFFRQHVGDPSPSGKEEIPAGFLTIPRDAYDLLLDAESLVLATEEYCSPEVAQHLRHQLAKNESVELSMRNTCAWYERGIKTLMGYDVDEFGVLRNAPCACPGCRDEGRQPGHRFCDNVPAYLLKAEEDGLIVANLGNDGWYWTVS